MSLLTLGSVGIGRDLAPAGDLLSRDATTSKVRVALVGQGAPAPGVQTQGAPSTGSAPATSTVSTASFGQLLVAQIPSEALLAYTTLLALFTAAGSGTPYRTGRWIVYGSTIVVCAAAVLAAYFAQRQYRFDNSETRQGKRAGRPKSALARLHLPILPMVTAMLSMAVYGLTVPGSPLQFELSGTAFGIWSGCLAVGGGVMMSIFAPFLGRGNGAKVP